MPDNFIGFLTLAVFSGLSMNLILSFGIGLRQIAAEDDSARDGAYGKTGGRVFLVRTGIYFASVMILWLFFSLLQTVLFLGFFEYILIFPVSSLFFIVIQSVAKRLVLRTDWRGDIVSRNNFLSDCFFIEGSASAERGPSAAGSSGNDNGGARGTGAAGDGADQPPPDNAFSGITGGASIGAALFIILGLAGGAARAATLSFGFAAGAAAAVLITGEIRRRSATEAVPQRLRGGPLVLITMGLLSLVFTSVAAVCYSVLGAN